MAKTKDEKPRGRMSSYAFFVQKTREDFKKKHPNEQVVFSEFSKKCSDQWKKMSESEKKKYTQMADKDKKRYDSEMAHYVPPKDDGKGKRGKKKKKDPNAPKRALSAFFWFCNDERNKVKNSLPAGSGVGDVSKECARRWNDLSASAKAKYEALAAKDKVRYEKEITAYKKKTEGGAAPKKGRKGKKGSDSDD
ncbi:High mobility group protein DSP1 [Fragariocoptes setiger]|uniref:High mobility group protein DSP1 n=1 Tax=Fragariocoptes setiger TaxID=1670756 RepID=A0ABQ7S4R8_9ACAR|nr:High mobility group protein DSP1 [Fragariocoptes setiger]